MAKTSMAVSANPISRVRLLRGIFMRRSGAGWVEGIVFSPSLTLSSLASRERADGAWTRTVVESNTLESLCVPHFAQKVSSGCNDRPQFPQNGASISFTHFLSAPTTSQSVSTLAQRGSVLGVLVLRLS